MGKTYLLLICLTVFLATGLFAGVEKPSLKWKEENEYPYAENLTDTYSGFLQLNWKDGGAGFNIRHLIFTQNMTILPLPKNFKKDMTMNDVNEHDGEIVKTTFKYHALTAGYIFDLGEEIYPYASAGVVIKIKQHEIREEGEENYTIKGNYFTAATGSVGAMYFISQYFYLKASLQMNPLMPFIGLGVVVAAFKTDTD